MSLNITRLVTAMCCAAAMSAAGSAAFAEEVTVALMQFETTDADPTVVEAFMSTLQQEVANEEGVKITSSGEMAIKDLALAAGCGTIDADCMKALRDFVADDRVVFGSIQGSNAGHTFTVKMYDFAAGEFLAHVSDRTLAGEPPRVVELVTPLVQNVIYGDVGELEVAISGPDSAEVLINGSPYGTAPANLTDLPLGEHTVTVIGPAGDEQTETVVLNRGSVERVAFTLDVPAVTETSKSGGRSAAPGIVFLGIGVAGLGLGIFSSLQVDKANADSKKLTESGFVDPVSGAFTSESAVAEAKAADLDPEKIENRGKTFQTLQYVGYGVGAVGVVTGVIFIVRAMGKEKQPAQASRMNFGFAPTRGGFATSMRIDF